MSTRIEPGEKLDDATVAAANARLAAIGITEPARTGSTTAIEPARTGIAPAEPPDASAEYQAQQIANTDSGAQPSSRKPRSDKGTKRGPIVSKEPEAFKVDDEFIVALTAQQLTDLNKLAEKLLAKVDLQPHHLNVSPAEWLLNARVQKHWRTLIGK